MTADRNELLVDLQLNDFLDRLAQRVPTPGGGAVAGAAGALSSALARMVAEYSITKKTSEDERVSLASILDRLRRADHMMRCLIDEDAQAYGAYSQLAGVKERDEETERAKQQALQLAMTVPLSIAATAADTLAVMQELAARVNRWMYSDLEAAAILAEATVRCAACSVRVNVSAARESEAADRMVGSLADIERTAKGRLDDVLAQCALVLASG